MLLSYFDSHPCQKAFTDWPTVLSSEHQFKNHSNCDCLKNIWNQVSPKIKLFALIKFSTVQNWVFKITFALRRQNRGWNNFLLITDIGYIYHIYIIYHIYHIAIYHIAYILYSDGLSKPAFFYPEESHVIMQSKIVVGTRWNYQILFLVLKWTEI